MRPRRSLVVASYLHARRRSGTELECRLQAVTTRVVLSTLSILSPHNDVRLSTTLGSFTTTMAPPAHFRLPSLILPTPPAPRRRSGSVGGVSTLHLARSAGRSGGGSGPPSIASGVSDDDREASGSARKTSLHLTPISPSAESYRDRDTAREHIPATPKSLPTLPASPRGSTDALSPLLPLDPGEWAAANAHPGAGLEDHDHPGHPGQPRRVQFATEASVEVYDALSDDLDMDLGLDEAEFERPRGKEMLAIVLSFSALLVLAIAAGLTTIFDWVL